MRVRSNLLTGLLVLSTASALADELNEVEQLTPGDPQLFGYVGESVAIDDGYALVGAPRADDDNGAAYLYELLAEQWTQTQKLVPPLSVPPQTSAFGDSVDLDGARALVGARNYTMGYGNQGAAFVFERQPDGVWARTARLTPADPQIDNGFGLGVSLSGNTAFVGAPFDAISPLNRGAVYVFNYGEHGWRQVRKLRPIPPLPYTEFGRAIAMKEDVAIVGAPGDEGAGLTDVGAAYIYERTHGFWRIRAKLFPGQLVFGARFGTAVAVDDNVAMVGAPGELDGAVYVFERISGAWLQVARLTPQEPEPAADFGVSVALSGSRAVIGDRYDDQAGNGTGAAYVFEFLNGEWEQTFKLLPSDPNGQNLGAAVSFDGDDVIAGAPQYGDDPDRSGAAYLFKVPAE